jgi:Na+/H+ antiporter NhaD/arsenite permease-like protein
MAGRRRPEILTDAPRLLFYLTLTSGILSAFLVNDAICLMMTPFFPMSHLYLWRENGSHISPTLR